MASAGFGMDFEWEAEESFTKVCQGFGNPRRWQWWLVILSLGWKGVDAVSIVVERPLSWLASLLPVQSFQYVWSFSIFAPLRILLAIVGYFLGEIWTIFARPAPEDWKPRQIKVHEALHLVAKDSVFRIALPAVSRLRSESHLILIPPSSGQCISHYAVCDE